ncbi:hypothetical protein VNO78_10509 [Psophocarpus tetragonolobus]|uniref:Uncharacterized protein n=1 Tax=Psophocarpus tetragonolobus TaxID=3891 RepID=A0AAN9SK71_PSOTE
MLTWLVTHQSINHHITAATTRIIKLRSGTRIHMCANTKASKKNALWPVMAYPLKSTSPCTWSCFLASCYFLQLSSLKIESLHVLT